MSNIYDMINTYRHLDKRECFKDYQRQFTIYSDEENQKLMRIVFSLVHKETKDKIIIEERIVNADFIEGD